jgi:hypothetical protein
MVKLNHIIKPQPIIHIMLAVLCVTQLQVEMEALKAAADRLVGATREAGVRFPTIWDEAKIRQTCGATAVSGVWGMNDFFFESMFLKF